MVRARTPSFRKVLATSQRPPSNSWEPVLAVRGDLVTSAKTVAKPSRWPPTVSSVLPAGRFLRRAKPLERPGGTTAPATSPPDGIHRRARRSGLPLGSCCSRYRSSSGVRSIQHGALSAASTRSLEAVAEPGSDSVPTDWSSDHSIPGNRSGHGIVDDTGGCPRPSPTRGAWTNRNWPTCRRGHRISQKPPVWPWPDRIHLSASGRSGQGVRPSTTILAYLLCSLDCGRPQLHGGIQRLHGHDSVRTHGLVEDCLPHRRGRIHT